MNTQLGPDTDDLFSFGRSMDRVMSLPIAWSETLLSVGKRVPKQYMSALKKYLVLYIYIYKLYNIKLNIKLYYVI